MFLVASAVRAATPADMEPAFGATIVSTHSDGRQAKLWLNRDQTYEAQGRRGQLSSGVWRIKGERLCLSQRKPRPGRFTFCSRFPRAVVGGRWPGRAINGERVINQLVPGR